MAYTIEDRELGPRLLLIEAGIPARACRFAMACPMLPGTNDSNCHTGLLVSAFFSCIACPVSDRAAYCCGLASQGASPKPFERMLDAPPITRLDRVSCAY